MEKQAENFKEGLVCNFIRHLAERGKKWQPNPYDFKSKNNPTI
jgi:hypothetical protein